MTMAATSDLSIAEELAITIERGGGTMTLAGENVELFLPGDLAQLLPELKEHKPELVALLQRRGGRVAVFPHCPRCASYYLLRENNTGDFECQTCGLSGIDEVTARRLV